MKRPRLEKGQLVTKMHISHRINEDILTGLHSWDTAFFHRDQSEQYRHTVPPQEG